MYWSATRTPTTATTIHSHGPRKIRLKSMSRGACPDLLTSHTIDTPTVHAVDNEGAGVAGSLSALDSPLLLCETRLRVTPGRPAGSGVDVRRERPDRAQVAVALGVV